MLRREMLNSLEKKIIAGAGVLSVLYVAITFSVMLSTPRLTGPREPVQASGVCAHAWAGDRSNVDVTAAYQGTAASFSGWIDFSFPNEVTTMSIVASEGHAPAAVCYLSGSFAGIPLVPGESLYTRLVVMVDEKTGASTLLVAGHSPHWSFPSPS